MREGEVKSLKDYFAKNKQHIESLMGEIAAAEQKFYNYREELNTFRGDLKEYYGFFVQQCDLILKGMQDNQMFNNKENNELRTKLTM